MKYAILALALFSTPAFATCPPGDNRPYPECLKPPVVTPNPSTTNEQNQQQGQAQGQGQGQGQIATGGNGTGVGVGIGQGGRGGAGGQGGNAGAVSNAAGGAGGNSSANGFSGVTESGNSTNSVGASAITGDSTSNSGGNTTTSSADGSGNADVTIGGDHYEGSQTVYQAAMPSAPPIFGPGALANVSYGSCGPYMGISSEEVNGVYIGLFRKQKIYLGRSDRIVEYNGESFRQKQFPDGRWYLEGKRAVRTTTVLNVSGSRQVSLGGGETGGAFGQAGAGGGSSMQRLVTQIDLEPCVAYIAEQELPVIEFKEPRVPRG